jgi:DNA polymerase I-like protein with 3'-5' exonuclease and polymerase domains
MNDIHTNVAKVLFGTTDVSPMQRYLAKQVNFCSIYGREVVDEKELLNRAETARALLEQTKKEDECTS